MKTKSVILLVVLSFLALSSVAGTALADGRWGWDRGGWDDDWTYPQHRHHHRHHTGRWYGQDVIRSWDRRPVQVYRGIPRYEPRRVIRRTYIYRDPWR
jgi:hypothetical protein